MKTGGSTALWDSQDALFPLKKNTTMALCTNKGHRKEERFHLLVNTISCRQPRGILWWSQRSPQYLGDWSLSTICLSYRVILPLKMQCFAPRSANCFLWRISFYCPAFFLAFCLSASNTQPPKRREDSHLTINSYYFSLKAHCPPQLVPAESVRGVYGKARRSRRPCNCRALLEYLQQYCKETSEKRVTEYSLGYGKSGLSRKGCLLGSSACGDQEWQGNDLEYNLVFNWASGAQGHRAPFAACVEQA